MTYYTQSAPELYGATVCKYIRCSHDDQVAHGDTLETQNAILDDFIQKNHCILVDTFVDEALTARKSYKKRKEFVRLLDGVRAHRFQVILFTKLDRWFRNIKDYHNIQEVLEDNGVQWKAVTENYDTTTTNGRLHINIRLSVAQDECDRDSDRIKDVFAHKIKNKTYCSGSLPRGLMLDEQKHVVINPDTKQFALDMFDFYEATCSLRQTLFMLQDKYQMQIYQQTVRRALRHPLYKGQYRDDPEFCEPLIDPERFDRVQKLIASNVRTRVGNISYIFSGVMHCPHCGRRIAGFKVYKGNSRNQIFRPAYRCNVALQSRLCDYKKYYYESDIEKRLLDRIDSELENYLVEYDLKSQSASRKDAAYETEKIKKKLKKLYDLYMDDLVDRDTYKRDYNQLQVQLQSLETQLPSASSVSHIQELLSQDWRTIYSSFSSVEKNAFWKSFIDYIVVHDLDNIEIHFL